MAKKSLAIDRKNLVIREGYYFLTVLLAMMIIWELLFPNIILAYFNLNYLIILWLTAGLIRLYQE